MKKRKKNQWMQIQNKADAVDIYIVGDIVDDSWKGWSWGDDVDTYPSDIRELLDDAKGKPLNIYINSGGGHVFAGMAIANMIARHDAPTRAIIDGVAASAASFIAFGADEIEMPENAYLMIHRPMMGVVGNADDMLKTAEVLETIQRGMEAHYMRHAVDGVTKEKIRELVDAETWLTGEDACEFFTVQMTEPVRAVACTGDLLSKWEKAPKELTEDSPAEPAADETKEKEIEVALAAY